MENDILIAGLMILGSVVTALVILLQVSRATREVPRRSQVTPPTPEPATGLPAGCGW